MFGEKIQNKKNKNVNSVEVANIVVSNLFTTIGNKPATYTLEGDTFLTLELQNPLDNKNNVIKIVNNSGYEHEITGTLPNVFNSLNVSYSKIEFSNQKGSFVTLMSDGSIYNVLDTSGLIKYE